MRPDEWREGMENEAASVEDAGWAAETVYTASALRGSPLVRITAAFSAAITLSLLWMVGLVLLSRFAWHMDANPIGAWMAVNSARFHLVFLTLVMIAGHLLGVHSVRPVLVALVLALIPLMLWVIGVAVSVQGTWYEPGAKFSSGLTVDFVRYELTAGSVVFCIGMAVTGYLSACFGHRARQPLPSRHR